MVSRHWQLAAVVNVHVGLVGLSASRPVIMHIATGESAVHLCEFPDVIGRNVIIGQWHAHAVVDLCHKSRMLFDDHWADTQHVQVEIFHWGVFAFKGLNDPASVVQIYSRKVASSQHHNPCPKQSILTTLALGCSAEFTVCDQAFGSHQWFASCKAWSLRWRTFKAERSSAAASRPSIA